MAGMTQSDRQKFERLSQTLSRNFRWTRLQALYLEHFPELLDAELVDSVCQSGIPRESAIAALLCQMLGLDTEGSAEDRLIYRDYIIPSVRIMDADKYRSDPYYKNVKIPNIKEGDWELRREAYEPYRAVVCADMQVKGELTELAPLGFFTERFEFPAVLEGGNEWMTLTPVDMDTCEDAIKAARGRVVTFGLGLGYYAYMAALKPEVESVTVIERSENVIKLFREYIFPYFPGPEKLRIINEDAFRYAEYEMPKENYDVAFVDIWRDASDGAEAYRRMLPLEKLSPKTEFLYWIEDFILSRLRSLKYGKLAELYDRGELDMSFEEIMKELTDRERLIQP